MNFSEVIKENASRKYTENGAKAFNFSDKKFLCFNFCTFIIFV